MSVNPCDKPKWTPRQQIDLMKDNGVRFEIMGEDEAFEFLTNLNFFFKLKAYDKNFDRYRSENSGKKGCYVDLDFAYLVELSRLDKELRYLVMAAALDIEHYIKVRLNRAIMDDVSCDGHQIVEDYMLADANRKTELVIKKLQTSESREEPRIASREISEIVARTTSGASRDDLLNAVRKLDAAKAHFENSLGNLDLNHIEKYIARLESSSYSKHVAEKYGHRRSMSYWGFLELATFGDIISFYKYYFNDVKNTKDESARRIKQTLFPTKVLRNAAAHNSCLLHELRTRSKRPVGKIAQFIAQNCEIDANLIASTKRVPVVHDFGAMLITHDAIVVSDSSRSEMALMLSTLSSRFVQHIDYFAKQAEVEQALRMISAMARAFSSRM